MHPPFRSLHCGGSAGSPGAERRAQHRCADPDALLGEDEHAGPPVVPVDGALDQAAVEELARHEGQVRRVAAVYAGTKAFVLSFSEALAQELAGTGVRVMAAR
ncbi:hypothetical protein [Lentzea sp. HUAS12]|uniref:hypothetical protein n=1 Tax=Lentzea sp. HUAS12 TaxID=2951806 RepID=UPI00209F7BD6|nr:hypothetical protein [Lentzea sp. HUAS12]USX52849.1 hypothetical protein ND450_01750 [Lentzea sp. HUAS12]